MGGVWSAGWTENPTCRPAATYTEWPTPVSHRYSNFLLMMDTWMPEYVERWNKYIKQNCAPSWTYLQESFYHILQVLLVPCFFFIIVYMVACFVCFCKLCIFIVMFMYSYCYVCSVLYILFSSYQLALFDYPDRFFRAFSAVVRQKPRYNSQTRGTARTLPILRG